MWISTTFGLILGSFVLLLIFLYRHFTQLARYGIPGPTPLPLFGNLLQQLRMGSDFTSMLQNEYGNVVGYYRGYYPTVMISDPEILKRILVKDFTIFMDREEFITKQPNLLLNGIFFMTGRRWKRVRNIISPIFSASKLRQMTELLNKCGYSLGTALTNHSGETVPIKELLCRFSMDTISSAAFGLDLDPHNHPNTPLLTSMSAIMKPKKLGLVSLILAALLPPTRHITYMLGMSFWPKKHIDFYEETCKKLLSERKQTRASRPNFIQMLLDAEFDENKLEHVRKGVGITSEYQQSQIQRLTDGEIHGNIFIFFFAGFETTASTLSFAAHILSLRPDIDEKLYNEICAELGTEEPNYDNVGRLKYMEQFLHEVLRFYPPVSRLDRVCKEDYALDNGITIPKGCRIMIPTYKLHHSEHLFSNPEEFNPERFSTDQKTLDSVDFMPFGFGPRHCVGMRFAQVVLKLGLVHTLRNVRFVRCEHTQDQIKLREVGLLRPVTPIEVGLEKRSIYDKRQEEQ